MPTTITKAEVEYALDREAFDQLLARRGQDTILTWWYQTTLRLPRRPVQDPSPGTDTDPRR